jgi:hypothetical protein
VDQLSKIQRGSFGHLIPSERRTAPGNEFRLTPDEYRLTPEAKFGHNVNEAFEQPAHGRYLTTNLRATYVRITPHEKKKKI